MSFSIKYKSVFDIPSDAICNTINVVGVMGAGIALQFKKRYPKMFDDYKKQCSQNKIKPGDCYKYFDEQSKIYILGLAVKNDWRHWSTLEWIESSIKSLKLVILENDIKSVNLPLPGGKNGRRGPYGRVNGLNEPPDKKELIYLIESILKPFSEKFNIDIKLCLPDEEVLDKQKFTLDNFLSFDERGKPTALEGR